MSPRRSARLESKPAVAFNKLVGAETVPGEDAEFAEDVLSDSDHEPPAHKKRKKGSTLPRNAANSKNVKGKRGRLRQLPEMPLDILYEIFGHLRPYDILRLSRTTKALRGILMRRSATSVWKDARANIEGLPDLPADLTEPQYASLAFDPFCHHCGAPNVQTILWACRVRSCQKCINSKFTDAKDLYGRIPMGDTNSVIAQFSHRVKDVLPSGKARIGKYYIRQVCLTADVDDICVKLQTFKSDLTSAVKYFEEKKEDIMALQEHARLCEAWQRDNNSDRDEELRDLKERRKEAIFDKLRESGWGEELDKSDSYTLSPLTKHSYVKKPQELTERIWSNIKQPLIDIMAELRDKRMKKERIAMLKQRQKIVVTLLKAYSLGRPVTEVIPGPVDICNMDEFKVVIEDTPIDVEVNEGSFDQAVAYLPLLVSEWRAAKDAELISIINGVTASESQSYVSTPDINRKQLELATTLFRCKVCYTPITYPRILVHSCTHDLRYTWRNIDADDPRSVLWQSLGDEPWNLGGDRVGFDKRVHSAARQIIEYCQQNPDTVTAREMDELDIRLECSSCSDVVSGRLVMGWRQAVMHGIGNRHSDPPEWKLLDEEDELSAKKKEKEDADNGPLSYGSGSMICCTRCRMRTYGSHLADHLKKEHGVEEITEDDYYRHLDAPVQNNFVRLLAVEVESGQGVDTQE